MHTTIKWLTTTICLHNQLFHNDTNITGHQSFLYLPTTHTHRQTLPMYRHTHTHIKEKPHSTINLYKGENKKNEYSNRQITAIQSISKTLIFCGQYY